MKYLCLGYMNPTAMESRPKKELDQILSECGPHLNEMYRQGHVTVDLGLLNESKVLRRRSGRLDITDGPFVESKELLGSVFVIEAADFSEAIRIASYHPTVQLNEAEDLGWRLEIRPVHYSKE